MLGERIVVVILKKRGGVTTSLVASRRSRQQERCLSIVRTVMTALVICLIPLRTFAAPTPTFVGMYAHDNYNNSLELYVPDGGCGPFPVVVYIHGGGWLAGDSSLALPHVEPLLVRGMAVASINYRFSYQAAFPAQLHDCKAAVRWLRFQAANFNLDPDRIAAFGESAGGHLAALVGTTGDDPHLEGTVGGNLGYSSRVLAFVDGYGPTDLFALGQIEDDPNSESSQLIWHSIPDILEHLNNPAYAELVLLLNDASPARNASADDPPSLIAHGTADSLVPFSQGQLLHDALAAAGTESVFRMMNGVDHELPDNECIVTYNFLQQHLASVVAAAPLGSLQGGDGDQAGHSVAIVGDMNGDGADDVLVGAPYNDNTGTDAGCAYLYSGRTGTLLRKFTGQKAGDRFGWAVARAGDVNGDGRPDLLIAAPWYDGIGNSSGRVYLYSGSNWSLLRTLNGAAKSDRFGYSIAGAADVNGDNRPDIAVGSPYSSPRGSRSGMISIFSGRNGAMLGRVKGPAADDRLGFAVAFMRDINSDGRAEVVVGSPYNDAAGADAGRVAAYGFDGLDLNKRFSLNGPAAGAQFGISVSGAGDVDGDGVADLIIGAPGSDQGAIDNGLARIISGKTHALIRQLLPPQAQSGQRFGSAVGTTADVNGDGRADVIVGAPRRNLCAADQGRVFVFVNKGQTLAGQFDGPGGAANFGNAIAENGDTDGDGQPDIAVGASGAGNAGDRTGACYICAPE